MKARLVKENVFGALGSAYDAFGSKNTKQPDNIKKTDRPYSDEQITEVGIQYQEFLDYIHSLNYDDLKEYAEKSGHFKVLDLLEYIEKKQMFL